MLEIITRARLGAVCGNWRKKKKISCKNGEKVEWEEEIANKTLN